MRIIIIFFIAVCFVACSASRNETSTSNWKLSWSDEFNYSGLPDSTKWNYDTGGHGWGNNELQYYTHADIKNVEVSNGTLKLRAIREQTGNREYSSARLVTRGKEDFTYGRIEIKAKLPQGRGLWPAFWMLGMNAEKIGWPECGEIDIMEHVGFEKDSVFGTVHTKSYNHIIGTQKGKKAFIKDPYNTWNTYSIEWTPEKMDFLLNGNMYNQIINENRTTAEWPFDSPFYILLNIAVGGNLGGMKGIDTTVFPAQMEVDYIRVYSDTNLK
jgi:beta-glucanase (GH16 family)